MKMFVKKKFIITMTLCNGLNEVRCIEVFHPDSARKAAFMWFRSSSKATAIRVQFDDGREIMNVVKKGGEK